MIDVVFLWFEYSHCYVYKRFPITLLHRIFISRRIVSEIYSFAFLTVLPIEHMVNFNTHFYFFKLNVEMTNFTHIDTHSDPGSSEYWLEFTETTQHIPWASVAPSLLPSRPPRRPPCAGGLTSLMTAAITAPVKGWIGHSLCHRIYKYPQSPLS